MEKWTVLTLHWRMKENYVYRHPHGPIITPSKIGLGQKKYDDDGQHRHYFTHNFRFVFVL